MTEKKKASGHLRIPELFDAIAGEKAAKARADQEERTPGDANPGGSLWELEAGVENIKPDLTFPTSSEQLGEANQAREDAYIDEWLAQMGRDLQQDYPPRLELGVCTCGHPKTLHLREQCQVALCECQHYTAGVENEAAQPVLEFYRSFGRYRFRIKGANGEKVAAGQGYTRLEAAQKSAKTFVKPEIYLAAQSRYKNTKQWRREMKREANWRDLYED